MMAHSKEPVPPEREDAKLTQTRIHGPTFAPRKVDVSNKMSGKYENREIFQEKIFRMVALPEKGQKHLPEIFASALNMGCVPQATIGGVV